MPWIETCGVIAAHRLADDERARARALAADLGRLCGGPPRVYEAERWVVAVAAAGARDDPAAFVAAHEGGLRWAAGDALPPESEPLRANAAAGAPAHAAEAAHGVRPTVGTSAPSGGGARGPAGLVVAPPPASTRPAVRPARLAGRVEADGGERLRLRGDRCGLVPLYHAARPGGVAFATRLGPLVRAHLVPPRVDADAVLELLAFEHVTGERTLVPGVSVLPPDGALVLTAAGACRIEPGADVLPAAGGGGRALPLHEVARLLDEHLRDAVLRAADGQPVTLPLSGGLDSRALLGAALAVGLPVRALTFGPPRCRDVELATALTRALSVPHEVVPIDGSFLPRHLEAIVETTGGMVAAHHAHILALAPHLPDGRIVLDGMGGDALTGGHLGWGMLATRDPARAAALLVRRRATGVAGDDERRALLQPEFLARATADPRAVARRHGRPGEAGWRGCHRFDLTERQRRFIQAGPLLLRRFADVRTPFYDRAVFDLLAGLPASHLWEQRAYLAMFARHQPALAALPDAARGLPLSRPFAVRAAAHALSALGRRLPGPLRGPPPSSPTDYPGWFAGPLSGFLAERLHDGGDVLDGIVRRDARARLLAAPAHGGRPPVELLGALLALSAWLTQSGARA